MKRILFTFICVAISILPSFSEGGKEETKEAISFEIMVIDELTEEPIPAAKIIIDQKEIEAYTDFDGIVKINEVLKGSHDIEISFISYQKQHYKAFLLDKSNNRLLVKMKS